MSEYTREQREADEVIEARMRAWNDPSADALLRLLDAARAERDAAKKRLQEEDARRQGIVERYGRERAQLEHDFAKAKRLCEGHKLALDTAHANYALASREHVSERERLNAALAEAKREVERLHALRERDAQEHGGVETELLHTRAERDRLRELLGRVTGCVSDRLLKEIEAALTPPAPDSGYIMSESTGGTRALEHGFTPPAPTSEAAGGDDGLDACWECGASKPCPRCLLYGSSPPPSQPHCCCGRLELDERWASVRDGDAVHAYLACRLSDGSGCTRSDPDAPRPSPPPSQPRMSDADVGRVLREVARACINDPKLDALHRRLRARADELAGPAKEGE